MPSTQRSSADFYSAVPNPGSESYPPSRSYANAPIPGSTEELSSNSPPPHFANDPNSYPVRRPESQQTYASQYSVGGNSFSPRPHSGLWGGQDSYDATPEGSQANLAGGGHGGVYRDKEYSSSGLAYGDSGNADAVPVLRKKSGPGGGRGWWSRQSSKAKKVVLFGLLAAIIIIAVAVAVPAAIVSKNKSGKNNSVSADNNDGTDPGIPTSATDSKVDWKTAPYGGNGSTVYMENGESFIYNNTFGIASLPLRLHKSEPILNFSVLLTATRRILGQHSVQRHGSPST